MALDIAHILLISITTCCNVCILRLLEPTKIIFYYILSFSQISQHLTMATKKRFSQDSKDGIYLYKCLIDYPELRYKDFYAKNKSLCDKYTDRQVREALRRQKRALDKYYVGERKMKVENKLYITCTKLILSVLFYLSDTFKKQLLDQIGLSLPKKNSHSAVFAHRDIPGSESSDDSSSNSTRAQSSDKESEPDTDRKVDFKKPILKKFTSLQLSTPPRI